MDSKDIRNLQEAYLDVYTELDEGAAGDVAARAQKLANQKKGQTPERKKMYQDLAYKARSRERGDGDGSPRTSRFERSKEYGPNITPMVSQSRSSQETLGGGTYERGPKRLPKSKEKYRRQVATGVRAASSQEKKRLGIKEDLYDIILSHLLDEGYAETPEAALAIMGNMSEDWRDSIVEEKKPLPIGKMKRKEMELMGKADKALGPALRTPMNSPERNAALRTSERASTISDVRRSISTRGGKQQYPMPEVGRYKPEEDEEDYKQYSSGETTAQRARRDPEFRTKMIKARMKTMSKEGYDLYDIILSHLINEGYADTNESAESIMVNMSEDWRESIVEEQKPLPRLRMAGQTLKKLRRGFEGARNAINSGENKDTSGGQIASQRSMKDVTQAQNMFNTLLGHSKEKAKAKETSNRAIGRVAQEDPASAAVFRKYKK